MSADGKPTPGPWKVRVDPPGKDYKFPYLTIDAGEACWPNGFHLSGVVGEIDAHVIGESGELFNSLTALLEQVDAKCGGRAEGNSELVKAADTARATLARAKGELP